MWRRRGFPPRWETLAGDEGGEEEEEEEGGRRRGWGEGEESRNYPTTPSLLPFPSLSCSLWAQMMYGCKGHMLAAWWIKALCRKITESASAHTQVWPLIKLSSILKWREHERGKEWEIKTIKEDGGREQGAGAEAPKHANTQCSLWVKCNVEENCKAANGWN